MDQTERKRLRWREFDYSTAANYFITLVVNDRQCLFGTIKDDVLAHSEAGKMIEQVLSSVSGRFPNVFIIQEVVMPNHVHLILQNRENVNITDVMRWVKSVTTNKYIHGVREKGWIPFRGKLWQRSYYDHFIRNQRTYDFVSNYIYKNPKRWSKDLLNVDCDDDSDDIGDTIKKMM